MSSPSNEEYEVAPEPELKKHKLKLQMLPSDPLILDRWIDVAFVALWTIYGLWGISSLILGLPTITQFTPDWYQAAWSGAIGCISITCAILATLVFFDTNTWIRQITKKKAERALVKSLIPFLFVYPVLLVIRTVDGDIFRTGSLTVMAFSFLVFPILRIHLLGIRIRALKEVEANATGANRVL